MTNCEFNQINYIMCFLGFKKEKKCTSVLRIIILSQTNMSAYTRSPRNRAEKKKKIAIVICHSDKDSRKTAIFKFHKEVNKKKRGSIYIFVPNEMTVYEK